MGFDIEADAGTAVSGAFCSMPTRTSWGAMMRQPFRRRSNSYLSVRGSSRSELDTTAKSRNICGETNRGCPEPRSCKVGWKAERKW